MSVATAELDNSTSMGEGPQLPEGWALARLDEVTEVNPSTTFDLDDDAAIPFIPMAAVSEESGAIDLSQRRRVADVRKGYVRFCSGDVIFAKITPCMENGKTAPVSVPDSFYAAGSTEFHVLRPRCLDSRYLWYWLVRRSFRAAAKQHMSGSAGQLRVSSDYLRSLTIPVPPLAEQCRIVLRIDELFAEIAEGEAALERARSGLDTWRRTLLKAAVTGDLTRDWRDKNSPEETGSQLLLRLQTSPIERAGSARSRRLGEPPFRDPKSLTELPQGWAWACLGDCISHLTSGSRDWSQFYDRGSAIFVMAQNIRPGRYDHSYVKYVDPPPGDAETIRTLVRKDDLLVTIVGANTGDVCRVDFEPNNFHVCQSVALVRPTIPAISEFFELYFVAPDGGRGEFEKFIYGAGRPHLSFEQLLRTPIPLPSIVEMQEIVRIVRNEEGDAVVGEKFDEFHNDILALRQSILKSAFDGRLLPQDPNDEQASTLLGRLRAESSPARRAHGRKIAL